jgi:hypothetical protein
MYSCRLGGGRGGVRTARRCTFHVIEEVCVANVGAQVLWPMECVVPVNERWLWHVP